MFRRLHEEIYSCLKKHGYNSHLDLPLQESFGLKNLYRKDGGRNKFYIFNQKNHTDRWQPYKTGVFFLSKILFYVA